MILLFNANSFRGQTNSASIDTVLFFYLLIVNKSRSHVLCMPNGTTAVTLNSTLLVSPSKI